MNKIHKQRLSQIIFLACSCTLASGFILYALRQNINVFLTPSQLSKLSHIPEYHLRLGGMVKNGSLKKDGLKIEFILTDSVSASGASFKHDVTVRYNGILPDLFREGKGVVAEGYLNQKGIFTADLVLAKHDENYMPKNVYDALRKNAG